MRPAVHAQVAVAKERNALDAGSPSGMVGERAGVQESVGINEAVTITNANSHAIAATTALPYNRTNSLRAEAAPRETERQDPSRLAVNHYVNGKNDEALLLDNTRIPRINSQSIRPLSAAKPMSLGTPWVLQSSKESRSNSATYVRSGQPQNNRNTISSAFPCTQPFIPKRSSGNSQAIPSVHLNAKQTGYGNTNVCKTASHIGPRPPISCNRESAAGVGHISSNARHGQFPMLRSVPVQSYGSGSEYRDPAPPKTTLRGTAATCEQRKHMEYTDGGCAPKVVPVNASSEIMKTKRDKTLDDAPKCEQRQMFDVPTDQTVRPSNIPLKEQGEEAALVTNLVAPPTEAMVVLKGMSPKIGTGITSAPAAHPLASQPASNTTQHNTICSLSSKSHEGAVISDADRKNSWNSCNEILEDILTIAMQSVGTESFSAQLARKEIVNSARPVAMHPESEQPTPHERPNNQPTAMKVHVRKLTNAKSQSCERTPGSCRERQCLLERTTPTENELQFRDSQFHAHNLHPIQSAAREKQHPQQNDVAGIASRKQLSLLPKRESSVMPESPVKDSSRHQQTPSQEANPTVNTETVADLIVVSERRNGQHQSHSLMNRPKPEDIIYLEDEKRSIPRPKQDAEFSKRGGKRTPKRKIGHRNLQVDQDEVGRLTKAIVFPDSGAPMSLAAYERKAKEHHEETRSVLNTVDRERMSTINVENVSPKLDLGDVDTLESEFWKAMSSGLRGKPVTVAYGVDVEAEGAFDSNEMSYVEWRGAQSARSSATTKRKRARPRTQIGTKLESKPIENAGGLSHAKPHDKFLDDLRKDADDRIECSGDNLITRSEVPAQMGTVKSNPGGRKNKRLHPALPRSHVGTLNRDGLLRHLPRMPGINHSMYYVGQLFTRFCWHTEDAFLNSVSYLHPGSAEKVWYAVPPHFALAFENFAASSVFSPSLLESESAGRVLLMNKTTMFDPRRVRRKGVEVYRVVHKPGSFVLTAPRAYHAGFNCGFNIAEAVNFANPTWFPVGREASLFARQALKPLCVPWEYLLFHEAKSLRDITNGISKRAPSVQRLESSAKVVAKEFKAIIIDGENKVRKYAEAQNCRVSMLHEINGLAKHNQLGPEFGNGAGMVCSLCSHACHFYAEMCASCDDTFEARCVDHFGKGHKLCLFESHKTVIVRRHDPVLLLDILGCLERLAGIKVDAHELAQRYMGYLRTWQTPLRTSGLRLRLDLKAATSRLPPKVSKEKGDREKVVKAKLVRDKVHREKRRKIRKPGGTFVRMVEKGKRSFHGTAEVPGGIDVFTAVEANGGYEGDGGPNSRRVLHDARHGIGGIPLL